MDSGYYSACAGLRAQTQALEVVGNNVANSNTTGYLGQQPTFRSLLATPHGTATNVLSAAINNFDVVNGTRLDLSNGNTQQTGGPLDLAIEGAGFFSVKTAAGVLYTRNGNFQVSPSGQLITQQGDPVLGVDGPVVLPSGTPTIGPDGTIAVDGAVLGKMRVVEFAPDASPVAEGLSYYSAPAKAVLPAVNSSVRQGSLETANINAVGAVVDLISVQRHFDMMQRALSVYYSDFNRIAAEDLPKV